MKHRDVILIVGVLFSLDSLVKLVLPGIRIHVGHVFVLLFLAGSLFVPKVFIELSDFIKKNRPLVLFYVVCSLHFFMARDFSLYLFMMVYVSLMYAVYIYLFIFRRSIHYGLIFLLMLIVLIGTGFFQFFLYLCFDYQWALGGLDSGYYQRGMSIEHRMRGTFLEPNWYGLILAFSYVGFLAFHRSSSATFFIISLLVVLCAFFGGNRLTLYIILVSATVFVIGRVSRRGSFWFGVIFSLVPIVVFVFSLVGMNGVIIGEDDRSITARTLTAAKVVVFVFNEFSLFDWLFGKGLSNWTIYAQESDLTIRTWALEQGSSIRDTSESYVLFFELGMFGVGLLLIDVLLFAKVIYQKSSSKTVVSVMAPALLIVAVFYYPIFLFMMYLFPYFLLRVFFSTAR